MEKGGYIYFMTNYQKTTLYVGVTSNLKNRVWEHKTHFHKDSFTAKYNLINCIYFEEFQTIEDAIAREKQLKKWNRTKKATLIETLNPDWKDLWEEIEGIS